MKKDNKIFRMALAAVFTAIIAVCSQISIPLPVGVPITLQTFAVALCGYSLSVPYAIGSVCAFIALGALGVPVFSSFSAGAGVLFGKTGGFIFGFILLVLLSSVGKRIGGRLVPILLGLGGMLLCHTVGVLQFALLTGTGILPSLVAVSLPFIPKDILSVLFAFFLSGRVALLIKKGTANKEI